MIGVNIFQEEPKELKSVMEQEKLNWRSFTHHDDIRRRWNDPPTPTFYVIDHRGIIRRKWVGHPGEATIDAALEKLIQEAENASAE